jgi:hypothetical protein
LPVGRIPLKIRGRLAVWLVMKQDVQLVSAKPATQAFPENHARFAS